MDEDEIPLGKKRSLRPLVIAVLVAMAGLAGFWIHQTTTAARTAEGVPFAHRGLPPQGATEWQALFQGVVDDNPNCVTADGNLLAFWLNSQVARDLRAGESVTLGGGWGTLELVNIPDNCEFSGDRAFYVNG